MLPFLWVEGGGGAQKLLDEQFPILYPAHLIEVVKPVRREGGCIASEVEGGSFSQAVLGGVPVCAYALMQWHQLQFFCSIQLSSK